MGVVARLRRRAGGRPGSRWREGRARAALFLVAAVALSLGVAALIGRAAEYAELADRLRDAQPGWLPLCLAGQLLCYAGYVMLFQAAARVDGGPAIGPRRAFEAVLGGTGAMVVASAAGGMALHWWVLHRAGAPVHEAVRRVLALNTLLWLMLGSAAAASGLSLLLGAGVEVVLAAPLAWMIAVPACVVAGAWVSDPRRAPRLTGRGDGGRLAALRTALADAIGGVVLVRRIVLRPGRHPGGLLGPATYWAGHLLALDAGLRAFGGSPGLAGLVLGFATGYVASGLPLPLGGAGGVDAAMVFALGLVGVSLGTALLGVVAYRVATFWLPLVPALVVAPRLVALRPSGTAAA